MPTMANITIKKADGTTDIVYTALAPSAGDKTPALWRTELVGVVAANRPTLSISSKPSQDKLARIVEGKLTLPELYTDTTTGITAVRLRESFSFTSIIRTDAQDSTSAELSAQGANILKSPLVQSIIQTGFAAT